VPDASTAEDPETHLPEDFGPGLAGRLLYGLAILFATFQIVTAVYAFLPSEVLRAVHVGFLTLIAAALLANHRAGSRLGFIAGWAIGCVGFAIGLYQWIFYQDLVFRSGDLTAADLVVGVVGIIVLFAVSWRILGAALPLICLAFLAYALFGQYLPAPLDHRPFDFEQVVNQMSFGTEGIYGTPTAVSATYIFLFILFGTFLERAGMIRLFTDVAMGLFGGAKGGPAKVAVFSSALMGTISGSGVANVVTTGQFTIPLMKRFGYSSSFAGGVEATASMGGQIMPPVMGAVAFIMAENIGVPYATIVKAAIIPAIIYFASTYWMVHLEAGKRRLVGMPRAELPNPLTAIRRQWHLGLPLVVLIVLLFAGFTPLFAGSVGLALTAMLIIGNAVALGMPSRLLRILFWIGLAVLVLYALGGALWAILPSSLQALAIATGLPLLPAAFFALGLTALVIVLSLLALLRVESRRTLGVCRDALADAARQALTVGLACAIVGTVIGTMTLTGTATIFGNYVVSLGREALFPCLLLVMVTSIVLGTGLPTIPTYIITAALAAPALLTLGVPLIVSHMFVFYYGIIADLTPPVALAALAAAPIARASPDAIGWQATRVALAGFLIPFMTVYEPSLMLQEGGEVAARYGYLVELALVCSKAAVVVAMSGVAAIGFLFVATSLAERVLAAAAVALIVGHFPWSDTAGLILALVVAVLNVMRARRQHPQPA
jgi:TRAP transporter 4TM/12TM fusion protein